MDQNSIAKDSAHKHFHLTSAVGQRDEGGCTTERTLSLMADTKKKGGTPWPEVQGQLKACRPGLARGPLANFPTDTEQRGPAGLRRLPAVQPSPWLPSPAHTDSLQGACVLCECSRRPWLPRASNELRLSICEPLKKFNN